MVDRQLAQHQRTQSNFLLGVTLRVGVGVLAVGYY